MSRFSSTRVLRGDGCLIGRFTAMGCSCEVLIDTDDELEGQSLLEMAMAEAHRIEKKWSRYVGGNIVDQINTSEGAYVSVDEESARLLRFADESHRMSGGLFDITSGVLRNVWRFDGGRTYPTREQVAECLPRVGWDKVFFDGQHIRLRQGMEIDLGGIGKEYAVDRTLGLLRSKTRSAVLVNFGGDVAAAGQRRSDRPWLVGIENTEAPGRATVVIHLKEGALATSGDSKRFVLIDGKRFGHILDPRTGWPVEDAPRSVTVASPTCSEAGFLSTLGILSGREAESVLERAGVRHWCHRPEEVQDED